MLAPAIVWWLPVALLVFQAVARLADADGRWYPRFVEGENGLVETATVLVLLPAVVFGLRAARHWWPRRPPLAGWFCGVTAVAFAFAGEEASWGQHWLGFASPEFFAVHNRQGETNIHNLHLQLGRIVKTFVTVAIIIAGLIVPLARPNGAAGTAFWPGAEAVPVALLVFGVRLIERLVTWFNLDGHGLLQMNLKESQEFCIAWFFLVYLWAAARRARAMTETTR